MTDYKSITILFNIVYMNLGFEYFTNKIQLSILVFSQEPESSYWSMSGLCWTRRCKYNTNIGIMWQFIYVK